MDRYSSRQIALALAFVSTTALLSCQSGCSRALLTAMYVFGGVDQEAEFKGLKDQRVAIVCRPVVELQYGSSSAAGNIAAEVGQLLLQQIRKIEIIDPQQVAEWTDEHTWNDFTEVGEALKADVIIGIDLEQFDLYQGQTLYQGKAKIRFTVYDVADGGRVLFKKTLPQIVYPPNTGVPTSEMAVDEFRRRFVGVVADQIGRHFYAHDSRADFAKDATSL